jgi:hypothetical protein
MGAGVLAGSASAGSGLSCTDPLPVGSQPVSLQQSDFVGKIDNRYWPMAPGSKWVYREVNGRGQASRVHVLVTDRTKVVDGIKTRVVRDTVSRGGKTLEDTRDWYAQDVCGNVWYFGENTKEFGKGGAVSTEGSWEAGVDGALAGVAIPAKPTPGLTYREEWYAGQAEDAATILDVKAQTRVPAGHFGKALLVKDFTTLEPRVLELKLYAPGVGPVEEIGLSGGSDRSELLRFTKG